MRSSLCLLSVLVFLGCGGDGNPEATAPVSRSAVLSPDQVPGDRGSLLPLSVGDSWRYSQRFAILHWPDGEPRPTDPEVIQSEVEREIVAEEELSGVTWKVERERRTPVGSDTGWIDCTLLRQDRSGLYLTDTFPTTCGDDPAAQPNGLAGAAGFRKSDPRTGDVRRAAANLLRRPDIADVPEAREALDRLLLRRERVLASLAQMKISARLATPRTRPATRGGVPAAVQVPLLQYPLHAGASWIMRPENDPFLIVRTVTGRQVIDVPAGREAAWEIEHFIDLNGPEDSIRFWYGQSGLLRTELHFEEEWTTVFGREGIFIIDDVEVLEAFTPAGSAP